MKNYRQFIEEVNKELAPILKIDFICKVHGYIKFNVTLCDSAYCHSGNVSVNHRFITLIKDTATKYTDAYMFFHNTSTIFFTIDNT